MKKSISGSMVFASIGIVITVFIFMSFLFTKYMERAAVEDKADMLATNVDRVSAVTYTVLTNQSTVVDSLYQYMLDNLSYNTQAAIMVFDNNGIVFATSGGKQNSDYQKVDDRVRDTLLNDEKIVSTNIYVDENNDKILTVGAPLKHGGEIFGGVLFNQRVPEIKKMYRSMSKNTVWSIVIAMLFSSIVFYIISLKITKPIKIISAAVTEFSKGNFEKKVEYTSDNELGELANNINHMAVSLENLESLRRGFVSDVSHELRTPMTTISGFVEGILDGTIPPENQAEYLKIVLSESKRLSRLVTNLLQISRMESGESMVKKTDFDINELVRLTLLKFEMMITSKNIEVFLSVDDGRLMVNADKDSMTQVLINLINNAVKFTPEGGKISIDVKNGTEKVVVSVKNTGHGIEQEKLEHIWERFYKADTSRGMDRSGVGLGLYIVKRIISMHNESISVTSKTDDFTEFTFTIAKAENV